MKSIKSTPTLSTTSSRPDWCQKYGMHSSNSQPILPPLTDILADLMHCGGSLKKLVETLTSDRNEQEMWAARILENVSTATDDLKDKWTAVQSIGTRARLILGKDQMLDDWRKGTLKNLTVLQSVARNIMPEVFGKDAPPSNEETPEQRKVKAHIADLEEQ